MTSLIVEKSLAGARWVLPDPDPFAVGLIARRHDLPEIVARLLALRGVGADDVSGFLKPTLREHMPDPFSLKDMDPLASFVAQAVIDGRRMAIFGDFDVDGATSSALLHRFLKHCGIDAPIYIPGRLTEGYGPNVAAFETLKAQGADIVFLLDCGTTAFETVFAGREMGLNIIILDHHEAEEMLPEAHFVVNPKRKDDLSGLSMLAAVGVTFMTCVAVNAKLRQADFYISKEEAPLAGFLDLVALGTVCDMVPLTGVNRLFVRQGFARMQNSGNAGLRSLLEVCRISGTIEPWHAGFVLGPRINAGSRVHQSDLGAKLLATDNVDEASAIAWTLEDCNEKRKAMQAEMEREAIAQVEVGQLDKLPLLFLSAQGWHQGLSGLVAGRLKEKYGKPACVAVFAENMNGILEVRGSGRSIPGVHIAQAFIDARNAGIIEKGGGHAMAGGFTLSPDRLEEFKAFLQTHVQAQMHSGDVRTETVVDAILTVRGAKPDLIRLVQDCIGPFGQEQPEPLFLFRNVRLYGADVVGGAHVRVMISDWEGGSRMKAMAFRSVGTPIGEVLLKHKTAAFDILGTLKIDSWGGSEKVEMHIKDAALVAGSQSDAA